MTMLSQEGATESLQVEDLFVEVRRSERRKVLQLTVDRGGELIVSAPPDVDHSTLSDFVRDKRFWIYTKLAQKETRQRAVGTKEFVSGEGFSYLGRSYRLLLVDAQDVPLKLDGGRFKLLRGEASSGRTHFVQWYSAHALGWLDKRMKPWTTRMGVHPTDLAVRDLGFRWGSCSRSHAVNFHWATILLPPTIIDYVIVHELAHLQERNHTPHFWKLVERALPDYEHRKAWLAEKGGRLVGL